MIILDTDILSIFAKSGEMPLLLELFGNDMGMTPAIMQEVAAPIDYGYEFPLSVINTIKSVQMSNEAITDYHIISQNKKLGKDYFFHKFLTNYKTPPFVDKNNCYQQMEMPGIEPGSKDED